MGNKKEPAAPDYEVGRGRPPKAFRWKKGQSGNPRGKAREPASEAELIEREFRQTSYVDENGEKVRRTAFEIIYQQVLRKEADGNRRAGQTRDRYQRFALANQVSGSIILRYAQNDFTRRILAELRRDPNNTKDKGAAPDGAANVARADDATPNVDKSTKAKP